MERFILIIDDSPTIRAVLTMIAQGEGYPTHSFADRYAALRWLISPEGRIPALILLDLTMPRMDGLTTLRHLRSKAALAAAPVVVLTCCEGTTDRLKARIAGASEYLTKPFTQEQIVALLHQYLALPGQMAPIDSRDHYLRQPQGESI